MTASKTMTAESFRKKIRRNYRTDDITNYIVSFLLLGLGIYFVGKILHDGLPKVSPAKYLVILAPAIPVFFGLYAIWRISKDYIVYQVDSNLTPEEKFKIIDDYLSNVKVVWRSEEGNCRSYRYENKFWSKVELRFFVDDRKLLYNVIGGNTYALKGVINFGLTKRATRRLAQYLNARL